MLLADQLKEFCFSLLNFIQLEFVLARNSSITSIKVSIDGTPNRVFSQGILPFDMWNETKRYFRPADRLDEIEIDATFYTGGHFGLFVDLRTMAENILHGSGLRLVKSEGGILVLAMLIVLFT